MTSYDYLAQMTQLHRHKPSPERRAIGRDPTPEARQAHQERVRAWNRDYARAGRAYKRANAAEGLLTEAERQALYDAYVARKLQEDEA